MQSHLSTEKLQELIRIWHLAIVLYSTSNQKLQDNGTKSVEANVKQAIW